MLYVPVSLNCCVIFNVPFGLGTSIHSQLSDLFVVIIQYESISYPFHIVTDNIFAKFGPDSYLGLLGSVMQGCTDTTLYVISLYFGSIGIKKIRYSMFAGLCADLIGIIASIILVNLLFT